MHSPLQHSTRIKHEVRVDPARGFLETPRIDHPTIKISKEIKTIKRKMTSLYILLVIISLRGFDPTRYPLMVPLFDLGNEHMY